jgi:hypothetical protein
MALGGHPKVGQKYGFCWVMGYHGHVLRGTGVLVDLQSMVYYGQLAGYGFSQVWFMTGMTVPLLRRGFEDGINLQIYVLADRRG